jgi:L-fucose isomerase-like protein
MTTERLPSTRLRPRLGVVISTWSHEDGHEYAAGLRESFTSTAPLEDVELVMCPTLLEYEKDIPALVEFFREQEIDAALLVPGNFTLDHVLPLAAQALDRPTILWGIPTQQAWGALVAIHQTTFPFKELGLPYRYVAGELGDRGTWAKVLRYARAAAMQRRLKGLRVGLMGWRAQGMSDTVFDELALRETFGVQVVNVGLTRYTRTIEAIPAPQVDAMWKKLKPGFPQGDIEEGVAHYGVRSYLAMQQLAREEDLHAVTVECFHDHLGGPCLGCSLFNDSGVAASCESDVPGALLMAACQMLSGRPTFHVDIIKADLRANFAILHHCGNLPRRLAEDPAAIGLRAIPEHIGPGAYGPTIQATMRPGPITIANLVGRHGSLRVCALEAEAVSYTLEFPGSAAKAVFPYDLTTALETLGNAGYGHHFVVMEGHLADDLGEWCRLTGVAFLPIQEQV